MLNFQGHISILTYLMYFKINDLGSTDYQEVMLQYMTEPPQQGVNEESPEPEIH